MQKTSFDPWAWGKNTNSVQAVEAKNVEGTLYCSGQVAIDENGVPSSADMRNQLVQTIANLEQLIDKSGYECKNIVRLNFVNECLFQSIILAVELQCFTSLVQ